MHVMAVKLHKLKSTEEKVNLYLSPAKTAAELGIAVRSVKYLVTTGELHALQTLGGQLRISTSSIERYRKALVKKERLQFGKICILHRGNDVEPDLVQNLDPDSTQFISHPFELLDIEHKIAALFIDARYVQLQDTPQEMIKGLQKKYRVLIYNSQVLSENSTCFTIPNLMFMPDMITAPFIAGYVAVHQIEQMRRSIY